MNNLTVLTASINENHSTCILTLENTKTPKPSSIKIVQKLEDTEIPWTYCVR